MTVDSVSSFPPCGGIPWPLHEVGVPKQTTKSSRSRGALDVGDPAGPTNALANLYRAAAVVQFARLEEDPTLSHQEKLLALYKVFESLVDVINRLSSPAPEKAPELWSERDSQSSENINDFILRVYSDYIPRGMTMAHLSHLDPQGHRAWYDWRKLPKNRGKITPLLTKKQANDQAIAEMGGLVSLASLMEQLPMALRKQLKLEHAVSMRRHRAKLPADPK
jgi:hypothetical protein